MTLSKSRMLDAMAAFIEEKNPYAATTIHFNKALFSYSRSDVATDREVAWVKDKMKDLIFRLDVAYSSTRQVVDRVSARDRFDAFCVVEKADRHPHVHMAWILPPPAPRSPLKKFANEMSRIDRLCCLLETFQRDPASIEARDSMLLKSMRAYRSSFEHDVIADWSALGWSVRTESTYDSFWPRYILKEMKLNGDFSDRSFFLSELHSDQQRIKPTRYHTIDPATGARTKHNSR
jgi:hypothetical protein